jgi:hypothetical protein
MDPGAGPDHPQTAQIAGDGYHLLTTKIRFQALFSNPFVSDIEMDATSCQLE